MVGAQIVIDGMQYQVQDIQLPEIGEDGQPTGEIISAKALTITDAQNPNIHIQIQMTAEQLEQMGNILAGRTITPVKAEELARLPKLVLPSGR